jgi:CRP/FNR family transcriptional regulator, cyclic AMP receptor protein
MVSNELLKQFPFFAGLTEKQLKALSMIAEEKTYARDIVIFEECAEAEKLYLLIEGAIDLSYRSIDETHSYIVPPKEFYAGSINPGEVFGISAMIEPYANNATAKASEYSRLILIDAVQLRNLLEHDSQLAYNLTRQIVKVLMDRLIALRVQFAASQS